MRPIILPGMAVPWVRPTPARVVAANGTTPMVCESADALLSRLSADISSMDVGQQNAQSFIAPTLVDDHLSHKPYVAPVSEVRATVLIHANPVMGIRRAVAPILAGFIFMQPCFRRAFHRSLNHRSSRRIFVASCPRPNRLKAPWHRLRRYLCRGSLPPLVVSPLQMLVITTMLRVLSRKP